MEEWRKIQGYNNYSVSNLGNVINNRTGKLLKPQKSSTGYFHVSLFLNGVVKIENTGRLVARSFIPNPQNKPCINHINCIKTDDKIENLEWVTYKENSDHAKLNGRGGANVRPWDEINHPPQTKLTPTEVKVMRLLYSTKLYSRKELSARFKISVSHFTNIINYNYWKNIN